MILFLIFFKKKSRNDQMRMIMVEINHRKIVNIKILNQNSSIKVRKNRKLLQILNQIMMNHQHHLKLKVKQNETLDL